MVGTGTHSSGAGRCSPQAIHPNHGFVSCFAPLCLPPPGCLCLKSRSPRHHPLLKGSHQVRFGQADGNPYCPPVKQSWCSTRWLRLRQAGGAAGIKPPSQPYQPKDKIASGAAQISADGRHRTQLPQARWHRRSGQELLCMKATAAFQQQLLVIYKTVFAPL